MLQSNGVNRPSTPFYAAQPEVSIALSKMLINMRLSEFVSSMTPQAETSQEVPQTVEEAFDSLRNDFEDVSRRSDNDMSSAFISFLQNDEENFIDALQLVGVNLTSSQLMRGEG